MQGQGIPILFYVTKYLRPLGSIYTPFPFHEYTAHSRFLTLFTSFFQSLYPIIHLNL